MGPPGGPGGKPSPSTVAGYPGTAVLHSGGASKRGMSRVRTISGVRQPGLNCPSGVVPDVCPMTLVNGRTGAQAAMPAIAVVATSEAHARLLLASTDALLGDPGGGAICRNITWRIRVAHQLSGHNTDTALMPEATPLTRWLLGRPGVCARHFPLQGRVSRRRVTP